MITIVCIGKKHDPLYQPAIAHFEERVKHYSKLTWVLLPHSSLENIEARKEESARIMNNLKKTDYVILLDETGTAATSTDVSHHIDRAQYSSQDLCIVIGGAYGVDQSVVERANFCLSFGKAVFPHQLVRLMVIEQLYRAYSILAGSKYHHQ